MNPLEFKQMLWETLKSFDIRDIRNQGTISVRCPFCGDSRKNSKHTHFYINVDMKSTENPVFYNCFLCSSSGIMTQDVLKILEIHDVTVTSSMRAFNKSISTQIKRLGLKDNNVKLKVPLAQKTKRNQKKLEYINKRLGIDMTFEEAQELKIIFDFRDFLVLNEIDKLTCSEDKALDLHENYVGFLSVRCESINFRKVFDSPYKRYEKYPIFQGLDNTRKFYSIPTKIDVMTNDLIVINIAEGPFDILGVYYNVFDKNNKNTVNAAATGSGFKSVVKYFVDLGVVGDNVILNIISDNEADKTNAFYKKHIGQFKKWFGEINILRNEKRKDFGEPKYNIKTIKSKL